MNTKTKQKIVLDDNEIYRRLLSDENLKFDELCSIIQKERVKEITTIFLKGIFGKKRQSFKVELFLSLFLIYRFHEIVFEGEGTEMDNRLLYLVNEIIKIMRTDILNNKNMIMKKLLEFEEKFNIWKKMDMTQQLKLYSETYYELELLKLKMAENKEANAIYQESINPLQMKIKKVIHYLAGNEGLKFLEKYKTEHLKLTVLLEKKLRENLKKAFWNRLVCDLLEEPANYKQIPELFKDIGKLYMSIVSFIKNEEARSKFEDDFNSILDIEYVELLLENNALNEGVILNICVNLLEQIKEIGIPKNDFKINNMILKINNRNESNTNSPDTCSIFKLIIKLLEELQKVTLHNVLKNSK